MKRVVNGRILTFALAIAATLAVPLIYGSCTPGSQITAAESDVIVTIYDKTFDFGATTTFALFDTIVHIDGGEIVDDASELDRTNDATVIARVRSNMLKKGFTEIPTSGSEPDFVIIMFATATTNYNAYSGYPGYGGGWYPWYPCCWNPYYPGYGGTVVTYAYTSGTLMINLVNAKGIDPSLSQVPIRWSAAINGVLDDNQASLSSRLKNSIDQAFDQSPYLKP